MPITWRAGLLLGADWRTGTTTNFGLSVDGGFKIPWFSLAAHFHAVPTAASSSAGFNTSLLAGGLSACGRFFDGESTKPHLVLALCVLGEGGQIQPQSVALRTPRAGFLAGGGGRARIEIALGERVYISVGGDLLGVRQSRLSNTQITPPAVPSPVRGAEGGAGAGAGYSF